MDIIPILTKRDILNKLRQEEIFNKYLGIYPIEGKWYCNPMRDDKNPDCSFKYTQGGILRFHDYAYFINLSCFDLVMLKFGLTFNQSIYKIAEDFSLYKTYTQIDEAVLIHLKEKTSTPKIKTKLEIKKRRYEKVDLEFWKPLELRDLLYVYPCKTIWLNGKVIYRYTTDRDIAFCYSFGFEERKIYFPFREKNRFLQTNSCIEGERLLRDKGELLIITKSYKDAILLIKLGYNAVASSSENTIIPKEKIQEFQSRFNRVVLLLDNDLAGLTAAKTYQDLYNLPNIILPIEKAKDIFQFCQKFGIDEGKKMLITLLESVYIIDKKEIDVTI